MSRPLLAALLLAAPAPAQDPAAGREAFHRERADAAKFFAADELRPADRLAAFAEKAPADDPPAVRAQRWREARWAIPIRPAGLPDHVGRVIGAVRLRHADRVNALAYSPDGTRLASASRDGTVRIWDLGSGRELLAYRGHAAADAAAAENANVLVVPGVAWSPDGRRVASCGGAEIHLWNPLTGERSATLSGGHRDNAPIIAVAWSPDGAQLLSGGDDRAAVLWDAATGKVLWTGPPQSNRVEGIAWSADGKLFATINASGELVVTSAADRRVLMSPTVTSNNQAGYGVAFGGGGVVTCGGDGRTVLTSLPNPAPADGAGPGGGTTVRTFGADAAKALGSLAPPDRVAAVAVAAQKWVVTAGGDGAVRVWDAAGGKPLWAFQGHSGPVTAVAARPDGQEVASGGEDGSLKVWPLTTVDPHRAATEATEPLWAAAVAPDGARFAAAGADRRVRVYDAATAKLSATLTGHAGAVAALAFLPDGRLASGGGDKIVKLWDIAKETSTNLEGHAGAVLALCAGPGAGELCSGGVDRTVRGWDAAGQPHWTWATKSAVSALAARPGGAVAVGHANGTLALLRPDGAGVKSEALVSAHVAGVMAVAFSPDGARLATAGGDGAVRLWNLPDTGPPQPLSRWEPAGRDSASPALAALAFSADGRVLASGGADGLVRLWDARSGVELRALRGANDWVTAVAFRPDGSALVAAGADRAARVFELTQADVLPAGGHNRAVRGVAVSPDGKRLATASEDRTVRVWDMATGREVAVLTGATDVLNAAAFVAPDEVAAAGDDGRLRVWNVGTASEVRTVPVGGPVFTLAAGPGGRIALAWARDKQGGIERILDGSSAGPPVIETGRDVACAALVADGALGAIGGRDGVVRVYDLATRERTGDDWAISKDGLADMAFTPDGKRLIAVDPAGVVTVGKLDGRAVEKVFPTVAGGAVGLVMSPAGGRFAVLDADGEVQVRTPAGELVRSWKLPVPAASAAFAPGGSRLITGNKDGTATVLELP